MKLRSFHTLSWTAAALIAMAVPLHAASPDSAAGSPAPSASPAGEAPHAGPKGGMPGMRPGKLTAEERKQYEDAKLKAATDPAVVAATQDRTAAQQEYEHAIKTEIIAKDPSMAPLLDKAAAKSPAAPPAASPAMKEEAPAAAPRGPMRKGAGPWANLAPEERQKLSKARKAVQSNPAVVQAEAKRKTAEKAYRDALHAAMLKADPTIAPLLEKMDAAMKGGGRGMGGEGKKGEKGHRKSAAKPGAPESATTPASDSQAESDKGM